MDGECNFRKLSEVLRRDVQEQIRWPKLEGEYKGTASVEGYSVDGSPFDLSDKDQKLLRLKDVFVF